MDTKRHISYIIIIRMLIHELKKCNSLTFNYITPLNNFGYAQAARFSDFLNFILITL